MLAELKPHVDNFATHQGWKHPQAVGRFFLPMKLEEVIKDTPQVTDPALLLGLAIISFEISVYGHEAVVLDHYPEEPKPDIAQIIKETSDWLAQEFADKGTGKEEYLATLTTLVRELAIVK
jgi:hypothetical protein